MTQEMALNPTRLVIAAIVGLAVLLTRRTLTSPSFPSSGRL
ncbi:hypothetical protein [Acetatifactor aquisgranensis]|nr:hypothetical protein [Acetatifactor aquisgranensis]